MERPLTKFIEWLLSLVEDEKDRPTKEDLIVKEEDVSSDKPVQHYSSIFDSNLEFYKVSEIKKLHTPYKFKYNKNYAFIVHYTSGSSSWSAKDFFSWMLKERLCTYYIDGEGLLWCNHDQDRCGWHTGKDLKDKYSKFRHKCAGVEIASPGKVKPIKYDSTGSPIEFKSWFGEKYTKDQVVYVSALESDYLHTGYYVPFTKAQEKTLARLIIWHRNKGLPLENVLGHDDICYPHGRKVDPCGSLSLPLKEFINKYCITLGV